MTDITNEFGQPIGSPVENWVARALPPNIPMQGRCCSLEPLDADHHTPDLFDAFGRDPDGANWTYLGVGPFDNYDQFSDWVRKMCELKDPFFHSVIDKQSGKAIGVASYLRINPEHGVIEVGHIHFSPLLQRTTLATEAMFLMMQRVFDELGYRRYEWKCDALNAPSRKAALRLGFSFEGIFRQALMYKGRNRDTAWFAIIDKDWQTIKHAFECWLDPNNFSADGSQRSSLSQHIQAATTS
ncbi:MAG: RimJ/RimL family protein N-acetyltransferase [Parasphingorhabdus sp.]|jgi:RimJ/RimL family protein N-acetyltransferase